jgi:isochorismate synthase
VKNYLLISVPESIDYRIYKESENGSDLEVLFQPFSKTEENIHFLAEETADLPQEISLKTFQEDASLYSKEEYIELLNQTVEHIREEKLGKIVISRKERFSFDKGVLHLYKNLVKEYPKACVYLLIHEKTGVWMGATPELLVEGRDGLLKTMSLAGTREVGKENSFEEKEEREQELVTDYILSSLENFSGISSVELSNREKVRAGNLYHFINRIQAKYSKKFALDDFFNAFHPTPAVGGFPKLKALDFIRNKERHDRSLYAGFFGIKNKSEFTYFVNLRCMQLFKGKAVLYAGGGITANSNPEEEWNETSAKMRTLLNVLLASKNK